ncbi:hypothetical protein F5I97DRAFT_1923926 [Phlebopus sp. FC_14]|nr:hypothetical protein F5I97DRAFT_1923926 [Phlebopus sp. FC_14]
MPLQRTLSKEDVPERQVNNILRDLRGEHFRRERNMQRTPVSSTSLSSHVHNQPTLPLNLIYTSRTSDGRTLPDERRPARRTTRLAGPNPPPSWRLASSPTPWASNGPQSKSEHLPDTNTPEWRSDALELIFSFESTLPLPGVHLRTAVRRDDRIPTLTHLCLYAILAMSGSDLADVVEHIPLHLRCTLLRHTAVHMPLSQLELNALCEGQGHVDGELIVVGPRATLHRNNFRKETFGDASAADTRTEDDAWDSEASTWDSATARYGQSTPLYSLSMVSTLLTVPTFLALPPTISRLALLNIPYQVPLQRLPTVCPLLVLLDLSYNSWLSPSSTSRGQILEEVSWTKLRHLEVVGLRNCLVTSKLLVELNRGRWEDIKIVR